MYISWPRKVLNGTRPATSNNRTHPSSFPATSNLPSERNEAP